MKRYKKLFLTFTFLIGVTYHSVGQSFFLTPNDTFKMKGMMEDVQTLSINQHNISGNTIVLKWKKVSATVPSKWDAVVCDNKICYAELADSGDMSPIQTVDSGYLQIKVTPHVNSGISIIRYAIWDKNFPAFKDTLTYIMTVEKTTTIRKLRSRDAFRIFPNPVTDCMNIVSVSQRGFAYSIFTITGLQLTNAVTDENNLAVSFADLPSGVYFLQIRSNNHIQTQQIIKQ